MLTRIITAVVLIAAVLAWLFVADYEIFAMGALFMYAVSSYEMGPLIGFKKKYYFVAIALIASTVMFKFTNPGRYIIEGIPSVAQYIVASGLLVWLVSIPLLLKYPKDTAWHNNLIVNNVIALLMLVPFLQGLLILRASDYGFDRHSGALLVLSVMALVWCADSGAYFAGRFFGKTKMLPNVSPKKTVEGLIGGLICAVAGLFIFVELGWFGQYASNMPVLIISGVITIIFSVIGDLVESMLKRLAGIKDSGKIFPGHGGMLDRIDSQLAAIPVFLTCNWLFSGELF
ncbi:MAG: phosphatidate cytidylyltransferase [Succinivibrio sp.]